MTPDSIRLESAGLPPVDAPARVWDAVREHLLQARLRILDEIRAYPTPIPACDQHFNWLLERREQVSEELRVLEDLRARTAAALPATAAGLDAFVRASAFVDGRTADRWREDGRL